ncbi:MAG: ribosome silencing factor [Planctomycetes bacterium]|nr:ribosome silencing factor [Planctomycetota bacterium]
MKKGIKMPKLVSRRKIIPQSAIRIPQSKQLAVSCAKLAHKKKAQDVVILNMAKTPLQIADYFLIASGTNKKQNLAIAEEISNKFTPLSVQGIEEGSWIVVDLGSVVVHIMHEQLRKFYDLEFIWQDAPRVRF